MESISSAPNYLTKPKLVTKQLSYVKDTKNVYVNLFKISLKKEIKLYQYPYKVEPEVEAGDLVIRSLIFKKASRQLKSLYGECFFSGDSLYAIKEVIEIKSVKSKLYNKTKGVTEYVIELQKVANVKTLKEQDIQKDQLAKQCIEILIRDILRGNPNLEFYKGLFVQKNKSKKIETDRVSINFYPGFTTSFMETDSGNYLNVTLKNKIISTDNMLKFLKDQDYKNKKNYERIKEMLIGRSFKVSYARKNYVIDDITFDANPKTQTFDYEGHTVTLVDYYDSAHKIKIQDLTQPLIIVKRTGLEPLKGGKDFKKIEKDLFFIPELCYLAGLDDAATKDFKFMKKLADYTKLSPNDRIDKTNEFLNLLKEPEKDKNNPEKLSAKEKSELYGIEVSAVDKMFEACYMKETELIAGGNKTIKPTDKLFKVLIKKNMQNWVCFYEKSDYDNADYLNKTLSKAAGGYGLQIDEPQWVEMPNRSSGKDWILTADDYIGKGKKDYSFAVFLLGKNDRIYSTLKKHSLCTNGYVSQVVKTRSLEKNAMSVCSKILLQINAKLQGVSYKAKVGKEVDERKLMIVGVDSSHVKGRRTGVEWFLLLMIVSLIFSIKKLLLKKKRKNNFSFV